MCVVSHDQGSQIAWEKLTEAKADTKVELKNKTEPLTVMFKMRSDKRNCRTKKR
ncbi:hypothetical protein Smp_142720 [Schistosoma mansoni]|uniref:hypothetical protein n=1 Tax=Schistosoma mansoni TaxID=6183 RepID=UPI0001A638F5|nr:hypothetical protein Smp_142720 [Schistosoma mansoni]|eukprot:XP_018655207.1 hypothetical protein Smp_142720 [Schistosoma mansoni]